MPIGPAPGAGPVHVAGLYARLIPQDHTQVPQIASILGYDPSEAGLKGSRGAGYGVVLAMSAALLSVATATPKAVFAATVPQDTRYQPSSVIYAPQILQGPLFAGVSGRGQDSPEIAPSAIFSGLRAQRPLFQTLTGRVQDSAEANGSWVARGIFAPVSQQPFQAILGQRQETGEAGFAAIYRLQPAQKPLWGPIVTAPQSDQSIPPSATWGIRAAGGLQTPIWEAIGTAPQQSPEIASSAAFTVNPASVSYPAPPLHWVVLTGPQTPQELTYSVVLVPTAALLPSVTPNIKTHYEINLGLSISRLGGRSF